jgi:hypothetical protein
MTRLLVRVGFAVNQNYRALALGRHRSMLRFRDLAVRVGQGGRIAGCCYPVEPCGG